MTFFLYFLAALSLIDTVLQFEQHSWWGVPLLLVGLVLLGAAEERRKSG